MTAYATIAELATFVGSTPTDEATQTIVERMLDRASELLDDVVCAAFEVDDVTDLPTDADVAAAMSKACCAVVQQWLEVGEENDVDGLAGTAFIVTGSSGYQGKRAPERAPRVLRILRKAGLLRTT